MWNLVRIKRLLENGEGQFLEFKKKANHPEKIVKELVAFANTSGGNLLLGVDDDGTPSGSREIEGEVFVLEQAIEKYIRPKIQYELEVIKLNQKKGLAIFSIPESKKKPHAVVDQESGTKVSYVRSQDRSLQASRELREIIRRRQRPKDIQFTFGDKEKLLLEHLEGHDHITLSAFKEKARLTKHLASRTLIRLVLANVLDVVPKENEDHYFLKN